MAPITVFDLQQAIAGGELALAYQPEVDLRTGHITAVEALARWNHPVHGAVPPTEFIRLAERNGYISDVNLLVLRTAVSQAGAWRRSRFDGGPLPIWINLSADELDDHRLHGRIMSALETAEVEPNQIGVEITETVPMTDTTRAATTLRALQRDGIRIALDDFGTGYSSIAHLRQLPIDVIKIDRSFVAGVAKDDSDASIVASMIAMAHAMRREVIAEGVEDAVQQRVLAEIGCDLGQGYLFARPQPPGGVESLLAADRKLAAFPPLPTPRVKLPKPRTAADVAERVG